MSWSFPEWRFHGCHGHTNFASSFDHFEVHAVLVSCSQQALWRSSLPLAQGHFHLRFTQRFHNSVVKTFPNDACVYLH